MLLKTTGYRNVRGQTVKLLLPICLIIPDVVYLWPFDRLQDVSTYKYFYRTICIFVLRCFVVCNQFHSKTCCFGKNLGYMGAVIPLIFSIYIIFMLHG